MEEEVSLSQWKRFFWIILPLLAPEILSAQDVGSRYELGGLIHYSFLREIGSTDSRVGTEIAGFGGRLVYRALPVLDVESEIDFSPGNSATSGNHLQALFGMKAGKRWEKAGVFLKARPASFISVAIRSASESRVAASSLTNGQAVPNRT
jgi:hypothetical protein